MTKIVYTVTLENDNGQAVSAQTRPLSYPMLPDEDLGTNVQQLVTGMEMSHKRMMDAMGISANGATSGKSPARVGVAKSRLAAGGK